MTRKITYEWQPTRNGEYGSPGKIVTLRIAYQPAGIDLDSGRRLPARFEAELAPQTMTATEIPFTGQRICWASAPRFSQQAVEAFAEFALSCVARRLGYPDSGTAD